MQQEQQEQQEQQQEQITIHNLNSKNRNHMSMVIVYKQLCQDALSKGITVKQLAANMRNELESYEKEFMQIDKAFRLRLVPKEKVAQQMARFDLCKQESYRLTTVLSLYKQYNEILKMNKLAKDIAIKEKEGKKTKKNKAAKPPASVFSVVADADDWETAADSLLA